MSATHTYGSVEYKPAKHGQWKCRAKHELEWSYVISPSIIAMLNALHPAPNPTVTLGGVTYERWLDDDFWRTEQGTRTTYGLSRAVDRIVELGGADPEVQP